jgi:hypothetical protein
MLKRIIIGLMIVFLQPACVPSSDLFPFIPEYKKTLSQTAINKCLEENPEARVYDCEIKNCLASPLTLLAMHELLINATEVLDELKIDYWVEGGSAIAAERFDAHLPWDDDVDLGAFSSQFDEKLRSKFAEKIYARGFEFKLLNGNPAVNIIAGRQGLWQVAYRKSRFNKLVLGILPEINPVDLDNLWLRYERGMSFAPHLDIFLWDEVAPGHYAYQSRYFRKLNMKEKTISRRTLLGPKKVTVLGREFGALQDFGDYGNIIYNSKNLLTDFYISREHSAGCEKLRFKDIRNHPELLEYLVGYLEFVYNLPAAKPLVPNYDSDKVRRRFGLK